MGCFVRGSKNSMGCFVRGDKNCMRCFVRGGKSMRDVLSGVPKMAWDVLSWDVLSYIPSSVSLAACSFYLCVLVTLGRNAGISQIMRL